MRQSKRQAQVCEPVVISSNEDVGEVCNLEKDMKMLIFRYLSLEYSLCSLFIITMHFLLLQKQTNMSDCGVFAIAFAMAICNRQRPELLCFDITKMRRHLYNCLEDGLMRHFPASHRQRRHETTRAEMVKVFCKCRLQEEGKTVICCDRCLEWYHSTCEVNVPAIAWRGDTTWTCTACCSNPV